MNDPLSNPVEAAPTQTANQTESSESRQEEEKTVEAHIASEEEVVDDGDNAVVDENFETAWNTMFDLLFVKIATVYYPLKGVIPKLKDNVIYVKVKNELMKENFEPQIRLALEYQRKIISTTIHFLVGKICNNSDQKNKRKRYNSSLTRCKPRAASGDSQLTPSTDSQLVKDSYP